ncbi:hypothetical protein FH972_023754 [Carpinus fangiana]|uniref:Uncharacterized protein n=1 Tax=Carpinus fangiana TaxID=176857 RepID=A0A5N6KWL1_9ROSI|nr:hypothetical protein FH972_023754 [Carpinus fangiana]
MAQSAGLKQLRFRDRLNWPAGKPIQVKDLLARLKNLANELEGLDSEDTEKVSLRSSAIELANGQLLNHKDAGVRAYAAVCLVETLRVCAPDAPFTPVQLNDIFTFFISHILPNIAYPTHAFSLQYRHVLKSLSETQSIVLVTDVRNSTNLIRKFFATCFDMLSNPAEEIGRANELHIGDLMQCLIDECPTLPSEAVDTIMAQFLRADPRTSAFFAGRKGAVAGFADKPPASYTIAAMVCTSCAERMALYVAQYFSSIIVDAVSLDTPKAKSKTKRHTVSTDLDEDVEQGPSEEDLKELDKAHRLLRELWRASPRVIANVIPQIESELQTENVHLRTLATETIGDMAAGIGAATLILPLPSDPAIYPPRDLSTEDGPARAPEKLMRVYSPVYQRFLGRKNDKHPPIRAAWTAAVGRILITNAGGMGLTTQEENVLVDGLRDMLIDNDEKVRIAAIQSIGLFDLKGLVSRIGSHGGVDKDGSVLANLADRVREKKHTVRFEAVMLLGRIWAMAASEIASGNVEVKELLGEIPSKIFHAYYINEKDVFALIDQVLFESLMPVAYPLKKKGHKAEDADKFRVQRLLVLFSGLDQRAKTVFSMLMARPLKFQNYVSTLLKRFEDYNGGVTDKDDTEISQQLGGLITYFAQQTPDASRTSEDLWKFAKLHDIRAYKLIKFCISPESDYRRILNSMKELRKRLENANFPNISTESVVLFVRKVANLYFNKSHIQPIISFSQTDANNLGAAANDLLMELTSKNPSAFKSHAEELCQALIHQAPSPTKQNSPTALDALKACAPFANKYPEDMPKDRKFLPAMVQYALRGNPPAAAKYAVSILMSCGNRNEMYSKDLLQKCTEGFECGTIDFLPKLACLSQLMITSSQELEEDLDPVVDIAINQILLQVRTPVKSQPQWDATIDEECEAKLWAMKILVNRIRPYTDAEAAKDIAKPVYQLLTTLINKHGELSKCSSTPESHKSRLRLQAALSLLKLSTNRAFDQFLTPTHFVQLALVAQDEVHSVRDLFVRKLMKYLGQDRLSSRFFTIAFLLAFEPSVRLREETMTFLRARALALSRHSNRMVLEVVFARFISLLAHHPDFGPSAEDLADFTRYIMFYLRAVATEENLGVIYHVAQRVKSVYDAIKAEASDNLYVLSDLAQAVIRSYEDAKGWSMQAFSGKIALPAGIFASLRDHETAQEIATKTYLPQELADDIDDLVRAELKPKNSRKRKSEGENAKDRPAKQRRSESAAKSKTTKANSVSKKTPRKSRGQDDESDDDVEMKSDALTSSVARRRSGRANEANSHLGVAANEPRSDDTRDESSEKENSKKGSSSSAGSRAATRAASASKQGKLPFRTTSGASPITKTKRAAVTKKASTKKASPSPAPVAGKLRRTARGK